MSGTSRGRNAQHRGCIPPQKPHAVCGGQFPFDDGKARSAGLSAICMIATSLVYPECVLPSLQLSSVDFVVVAVVATL